MSRQYIRSVVAIVSLGLLGTATFNAVVDPFGVIGTPRLDGFNAEKPEASRRERLIKAYEVRQLHPTAVILGTSRAKCLDPTHPHFSGVRAYNLALSSSSIYEQWRYFEHALVTQPLEEAVIGLDFDAFREGTSGLFSESRLASLETANAQWHLDSKDLLSALLSFDALRSSFATVANQEGGRRLSEAQKMQIKVRRYQGQRAMFQGTETGAIQRGLNAGDDTLIGIGTIEAPQSYRKLLRLAHRSGVKLHLFISPYHARFFEAWQLAGQGPRVEEWKRTLVAVNVDEARLAGGAPFPLWDFSGYNGITTEPVPEEGDVASVMRGYSEGSHYREEIGRLIFDRMFAYRDSERQLPEDFGVLVDEHNLEAHFAAIRAARERYHTEFPEDVAELQRELERQQLKRGIIAAP